MQFKILLQIKPLCSHKQFHVKVFGTNTTDKAVEKYVPDIKGNATGGARTCYVVQLVLHWFFVLRQKSNVIKSISGQL